MKKFFALGLVLLGQIMLNAQANKGIEFVDGWCLTQKGDTLKGKISMENTKTGERFDKIKFIDAKDANGQKKNLGIEKINSFGIANRTFEFITNDNFEKPVIMERLITGDLCLYKEWYELPESTPQKKQYEIVMWFIKKDASSEPFPINNNDKKFVKEMSSYFKGDNDIIKLIKENNYTYKDLDKIVQAYNAKE
jgi:hypothetical protein